MGLYKKARAGEIEEFTGVSARYEAPERPALTIRSHELPVDESGQRILPCPEQRGVVARPNS